MADVKITLFKNGPMKVEGAVELLNTDGSTIVPEKSSIFLCRCGASTNKPFCDGMHSKIGFQAAAEAVPESAE